MLGREALVDEVWFRGLLLFYLGGGGVERDLHSFPTRRSSDLDRDDGDDDQQLDQREGGPSTLNGGIVERSEEHTSELQSRFDLVCRLLLEKKNTRNQPRATTISPDRSTVSLDCSDTGSSAMLL